MRIAKSVTLDLEVWSAIEKLSYRDSLSTSRMIEQLVQRGIRQKMESIQEAKNEVLERAKEGIPDVQ